MNILHLHTSLNLTCGISKSIYLITKYPKKNNKHFVIALNGDAYDKFYESDINIKLLNLNNNSPRGILKIKKTISKFITEKNIDIVHSHHRFFDFITYIISFSLVIKRVTSVQSFVYGKKLLSYKSPILLAAGDSVKQHLIKYFKIKEDKIIVFNNFIDINEVPKNYNVNFIRKDLNIPFDAYLIGYVGRFSIKEKGIDILLKAFEMFEKKHKNVYLLMVGEGNDIKKINIPVKVKLVSPRKNIFDYYSIFDCLILPSRVDPFPLTVLEAGMMKVPFIGANVNGISEMISDDVDGLLFEKEDINTLFDKMEIFYSDKNIANKCAENLYKKVLNKYNHRKAIDLLNDIYEKC